MIELPKIGEGDETELRAEHGLLDAPARDLAGRPGLPLHAGHLARDGGRRRAARRPADEDLRRNGEHGHERAWRSRSSRARAARTTSATCAPTRCCALQKRRRRVGAPRRAALPDGAPVVGAVAEARVERGRGGGAARRRRTTSPAANRLLRRASDCLKLVTSALDMLEHMSPWEYTEVRKVLGHGSGFDSPGFREIRRVAKPLGEAFHAARERAGLSLVEVYTHGREYEDLYTLAEQLIEFDERVIVWRVRHFKVVQRMIGARRDRHAGHARRGDGPPDPPLVLPRALGRAERADADEPARMSFARRSRSAAGTSAASARRRSSSGRGSREDEAFAIMDRAWDARHPLVRHRRRLRRRARASRGSATGAPTARPDGLRAHDEGLPLDDRRRRATRGLAPDRIRRQVEGSLERLGVERIDLYLAHEPDPATPLARHDRTLRGAARARA